MKKLSIPGFVFALMLFAACQSGPDTSGNEPAEDDTIHTGLEGTRDQPGQLTDVKQDTSSGQATTSPLNGNDTTAGLGGDDMFLRDQIKGNHDEIGLSQLAARKSTDKEIKDIANYLVAEHTKTLDKIKQMSTGKRLEMATGPSADASNLVSSLENKQAKEFDKAWTEAQINMHKISIGKYESAATTVTDPKLKSFINETLPHLRMHLDKLMAYNGKVKS